MFIIEIATGLPGSGKSLWTAKKAIELLDRNLELYKKAYKIWINKKYLTPEDREKEIPKARYVYSNIKFSKEIEEKYGNLPQYWEDPRELVLLKDVDIIWDEVATHLDSTQWANLSLEVKRFLQQHRKRGISIYGNTQEFLMIDISMRRLTQKLWVLTKIFGSPDPSPTLPTIKRFWGLIWVRRVDPLTFDDEGKRKYLGSEFFTIKRKYVEAYNTRQEIKRGLYPPLKHMVRTCELPNCEYHKIEHK